MFLTNQLLVIVLDSDVNDNRDDVNRIEKDYKDEDMDFGKGYGY